MSKSLLITLGLGCCLAALLQQMAFTSADPGPQSQPRIIALHRVARSATPPRSRSRFSAFEPRVVGLQFSDEGTSPPRPEPTSVPLLRDNLLKRLTTKGASPRDISKPASAALMPPGDIPFMQAKVFAAACPARFECARRSMSTAGRDPPQA